MVKWLLNSNPYQVQQRAIDLADGKWGFAYFMEMGLGKTATVLAEFYNLWNDNKVDCLIVVCPPSLKHNWINESISWGLPESITKYVWPKTPKEDFPNNFILSMNYESFSSGNRKGLSVLSNLCSSHRVMLVLDESTQIKNHQSKRTKALQSLSQRCSIVRILSGAPMVQGPQDLYPQLKFIGALGKMRFTQFRENFCRMGGYMGKQIIGTRNEEELRQLINEYGFRATKAEYTDLPLKLPPITYEVEMSVEQSKIYKQMKKDFVTIVQGVEVEAAIVITQLLKLQQIASNFVYDENKKPITISQRDNKFNTLVNDILPSIVGKAIIFTHYKHTTLKLYESLYEDYKCAIIAGKDFYKNRDTNLETEKKKFNENPECRVIIVQTNTGKYGHTLLGGSSDQDKCHTSIFYENNMNLDDRIQAEDRNHRHGQTHPVTYIDLVCSVVEKSVIIALQKKLNVAKKVVDDFKSEKG